MQTAKQAGRPGLRDGTRCRARLVPWPQHAQARLPGIPCPGPRDATPSLQLERGCPAPNPTVTAFSGPRFLGDQLLSLGLPSKQAVLRGPLPSRESRAPTMCLQSGLGAVTYTVGAAGWSGLGLWG